MVVGLSIGGLEQQVVMGETHVPFAAIGVQDPERRPTPRRAVAVVRHEGFRALADDVAAQADPRPASQLQPDAGRLGDRGREATGEAGRIEDQEQGLRASGERGQSMESIGDAYRLVRPVQSAAGEIDDEHVHRPTRQQGPRDAEALVQARRGDDDEPFEPDTASDGLDRIETARQIQPGHDGPGVLRLRRNPQRERRPPARAVTPDRDAGRSGETTRPEDRIQCGKTRVDDPIVARQRCHVRSRRGRESQRPHHPRSCRTPPSPQARDSSIHITTSGRHRTPRLEQMFYHDKSRTRSKS